MLSRLLSWVCARNEQTGLPAADPMWLMVEKKMRDATTIVDLGCGANPHPRATVGVDAFLDPVHRIGGFGATITPDTFSDRPGFKFVQADLTRLPFEGRQFDFAYSHHVFEHLPDPKAACAEMCRIASLGAIVTPAPFAELAFGRPYHLWLVLPRGGKLFFIRKMPTEDRPFGEHPLMNNSRFIATKATNPFDMLLNDGNWYSGSERMPRLSRLLRKHWHSHSPVMETVFLWEKSFDCIVINEDGSIV